MGRLMWEEGLLLMVMERKTSTKVMVMMKIEENESTMSIREFRMESFDAAKKKTLMEQVVYVLLVGCVRNWKTFC